MAGGARVAAQGRLPRGRHKLGPEQVAASQRARLFSAMASVTATKGYAATTVADLLEAAGVSRETFYEQFRSKLDCFEQTFNDSSALLFALVAESAARPEPSGSEPVAGGGDAPSGEPAGRRPPERFERLLGSYLDVLATFPQLARLCLVEVYAAGPAMARRRAEVQERFAAQMETLFDVHDEDGRFACRALVAAIGGMVTARLAVGDIEGLRALREPFAFLVRQAFRPSGRLTA